MSDSLTTRLDVPYAWQPETRAAALRYLERTGNVDVAQALGLVSDPLAEQTTRARAIAAINGKQGDVRAGDAR